MDQLGESIRKLILAGIGAAAVTREKGESVLRDLVKKGELTVEQGKVLNEELKRNVKEAIRDNVTVHVVTPSDDLMSAVDDMDEESLAALKERIRAAKRAANPDGITENTSKKKQQLREKQEREAAAKRFEEKKLAEQGVLPEDSAASGGEANRPYARGRAYQADRYAKEDNEE